MFTELGLLRTQVPRTAAVFNLISSHDKPGSAAGKDLSPTAIFLRSPEGAMTARRAVCPATLARATGTFMACRGERDRRTGVAKKNIYIYI